MAEQRCTIPKHYWINVNLRMLIKEYFVLLLLSSHSFFSSALCPQADTTNRSNLVDTMVSVAQIHNWCRDTACSLLQAPAASISTETPSPLRLSSSRAARGWFCCTCWMHLVPLRYCCYWHYYTVESFWISYALLGSQTVNWVIVSFYLIFQNTCLQRVAFSMCSGSCLFLYLLFGKKIVSLSVEVFK